MGIPADVLDAYGIWIAGLAPWSHFVTLTHRLPDSSDANVARLYTRVGIGRHRRLVREWFHGQVRPRDRGAQWWSEMELHATGIPHEHALLAVSGKAPVLSMRQAWFDVAGYARLEGIENPGAVARYVAKYAGKSAAWPPCVWGFGLLPRPSFSQVLRPAPVDSATVRPARERSTHARATSLERHEGS